MWQALRYVPPSWSLWRSGRGREIYRVREIELDGTTDQDTKRRGFRQLPSPSRTRHCDHYVVLLQNSKRVSSNGGLRCGPMGTEDYSTWPMRCFWFHLDVVCYRQVWVCLANVELTPEVYFVYRLYILRFI